MSHVVGEVAAVPGYHIVPSNIHTTPEVRSVVWQVAPSLHNFNALLLSSPRNK